MENIKVCMFGTYNKNEVSNHIILQGLRKNGIYVDECRVNPIHKINPKKNKYTKLTLLRLCYISLHQLLNYVKIIIKFHKRSNIDIIIVPFPGYTDIFLIKLLTLFKRTPIVYTPLMSLYDTLVIDRKLVKNYIISKLLFLIDKYACKLSDVILLDTQAHIKYFCEKFNLKKENFIRVFVGADEDVFHPIKTPNNKFFNVLYYGRFVPLQGIEYIVKASKLLENHKNIKFTIIGIGQMKEYIFNLATQLNTENIKFIDWLSYKELREKIAESDLCLSGPFGTSSKKAERIISLKTYQMIAMKKPTIICDSEASKELFTHKENCYMCKIGDENAIAKAILTLKNDPNLRNKIASNGYNLFRKNCSSKTIGKQLKNIILNQIKK